MKRIFTLFFLLSTILTAKSQSTTIVISQIYGGGGATSGTPAYHDDYIELHNLSLSPVTLPNWSVQYGSQNGNIGGTATTRIKIPAGTVIPAGGYYLIQILSADSATVSSVRVPIIGAPIPVVADLVVGTPGTPANPGPYVATIAGNPALSGTNGKVALLNDTTLLACGQTNNTPNPCTLPLTTLVDLVGYGDLPESPTNFETYTALGDSVNTVNGGKSLNTRVVAVRKNSGNQDTQNNNADFDTVQNAVPRSLPVKIGAFSVLKVSSSVLINWSTEQEFNSSYFIIERSGNGNTNWTAIATVTAAGNSNTKRNYSFTDNSPLKGINYYRLKQVDIAGKTEYSFIRKLLFNTKYQVLVTPNPTRNFINLYVAKNNNEAITVQLTDISGKRVRSLQTVESSVQINIEGLSKGTYFIKVIDGSEVTTKKVMIQ